MSRVDGKSNEITAMLALRDVKGKTMMADAMHTQRVKEAGGVCVPALKGNRETLHDDDRLHKAEPANAERSLRFTDVDKGHWRIETREATVCTTPTRWRTCIADLARRPSGSSPQRGRPRRSGARRPASTGSSRRSFRSGS